MARFLNRVGSAVVFDALMVAILAVLSPSFFTSSAFAEPVGKGQEPGGPLAGFCVPEEWSGESIVNFVSLLEKADLSDACDFDRIVEKSLASATFGSMPQMLAAQLCLLRWQELGPDAFVEHWRKAITNEPGFISKEAMALSLICSKQPHQALSIVKQLPESSRMPWLYELRNVIGESHPDSHAVRRMIAQATRARMESFGAIEELDCLDTLVKTSPEAALGIMAERFDDGKWDGKLSEYLEVLAESHPALAGSFAIDVLAVDSDTRDSAQRVIEQWAAADMISALEAVRNCRHFEARRVLLQSIYGLWAEDDPRAAVSSAYDEIPELGIRRDVMTEVLVKWAQKDPAAATKHLMALPLGAIYKHSSVFLEWIKTDPEAATACLVESSMRNRGWSLTSKEGTIGVVACKWAEWDIDAAANWACSLPEGSLRDQAVFGVAKIMAKESPERSAKYALGISNRGWKRSLFDTVICPEWVAKSPLAAYEFALQLDEGDGRCAILRSVAEEWADSDPIAAAGVFPSTLTKLEQYVFASTVVRGLAAKDPKSAVIWLEDKPEWLRRKCLQATLYSWAGGDPVGAADYFLNLPDGFQKGADICLSKIAKELYRINRDYALEWCQLIGGSELRAKAMGRVLGCWMDRNPAQAKAWFNSLPESGDKQAMAFELIEHECNMHPLKLFEWLVEIDDGEKRERAFKRLCSGIGKENVHPDDVRRIMLEQRDLNQEEIEKLKEWIAEWEQKNT